MIWHTILHWLGVDNVSGPAYGWWSGAGSDIGELAIIGAVIGTWRRVNCHVKGCPRIGRHPAAGGQFVTCRRHSPDPDVRAGLKSHHIHAAHQRHMERLNRP